MENPLFEKMKFDTSYFYLKSIDIHKNMSYNYFVLFVKVYETSSVPETSSIWR